MLEVEIAGANHKVNYILVLNRHKEQHKEAWRDQQERHKAEMAKLPDILTDPKAQVGAISAPRSVALTITTDNRERPVWNTDGAPKKWSNPTPEQGEGNGGGQKPPTTMHGAGDPDPDDSDDDDDDEGQDPKGGPSHGEKGKERAGPDPQMGDEEEEVVDVMAKAIARE